MKRTTIRQFRFILFTLALPGAALGWILGGILTNTPLWIYESSVEFRVEHLSDKVPQIPVNSGAAVPILCFPIPFDPIRGYNTLAKVSERLGLAEKWNADRDQSVRLLRASISRRNLMKGGRELLLVRRPDAEEARDIAAASIALYRDFRLEYQKQDAERRISSFSHAIRELESLISELEDVVRRCADSQGSPESSGNRAESIAGLDEVYARQSLQREKTRMVFLLEGERLAVAQNAQLANPVVILSQPQIARWPSGANYSLALLIGAVAGFIGLPGLLACFALMVGRPG